MTPVARIVALFLAGTAVLAPAPVAQAGFPGDNGQIVVTACGGCEGSDDPELYSIAANGRGFTRITRNSVRDASAEFSPNGRHIVFTCRGSIRNASKRREICIARPNGEARRRVTTNRVVENEPTWSANGRRIAFVRGDGRDAEIWTMKKDGSRRRQVTDNDTPEWGPEWSPSGDVIAFTSARDGDEDIYVVSPDGSDERRLFDTGAHELEPEWSPTGGKIAFQRYTDPDGAREGWHIFIRNLKTEREHRVVMGMAPAWSPDGRLIAYTDNALYRVRTDGTHRKKLRDSDERLFASPTWQPL